MGKIVAIGGGSARQTRSIRQRIITLAGRRRPRVLVVPTAGGDRPESWQLHGGAFARLGCVCDVLWLLRQQPSHAEIRRKVRGADVVFVGGGNTLMMMRRWAFLGVDDQLRRAYRRGTVLCGGSTGAICWFEYGHSDSMRGYGHDPWDYIRVAGLGLVDGTFCPHYHYENRVDDFHAMIRRKGGFGIACDDGCAIEIVDGRFRVLAGSARAKAYTVVRRRGHIIERSISRFDRARRLDDLYAFGQGE